MRYSSAVAFALVSVASVPVHGFTTRSWDDAKALAQRVVANLTIDEKIGLTSGVGQLVSRCVGNLHAVDRLNVSSICFQDGPAGLRASDFVSGFPAGISAAATFDKSLIRARGVAIGEEFRTKGAHIFLGPAMDVMRAPDAGRLWESFGADPYLTGEAVYETIIGVQSVGVQACAKHLIGNQQESFRYEENSVIDQRTLVEKYWRPFSRAVDADVTCTMCSYNKVNGTYACANGPLIGETGILKKGLATFKGFVVSDWGATHGSAADTANSGLDVEMPGDWILIGGAVYGGLKSAVQGGSVSQTTLDTMVTRTLTAYFRLGQESGFPATSFNVNGDSNNGHVNARSDAHTALIRQIASASTVLLKNKNNVLPLSGKEKSLAVIGLDAIPTKGCNLNACNDGTLSVGWGSGTNELDYLVAPITSLQSYVSSKGNVTTLVKSLNNDQGNAAKAAKGASAALVFVNADSGEYNVLPVDWNTGDRKDNLLWGYGDDLIKAVAAVNNNTIVVIHSVGPNILEEWIDHPNVTAVVMAGLPGEQSGPSIVDVLYGAVNPSGRLPYTIAKASSDYSAHTLQGIQINPTITYTEGLLTDYMHFDANNITPRYEFGYGLSYSFTAAYSGLSVSSTKVSVTVKNTGTKAGTEIVQLYLGYPSSAGEPPKQLRGFEAVKLAAGASATVSFALTSKDISIWDVRTQSYVRPAGTFTAYVGSSSRDIRLTGTF